MPSNLRERLDNLSRIMETMSKKLDQVIDDQAAIKQEHESQRRKLDTMHEFPYFVREPEHTTSSQRQSVSGAKLRISGYRN